MSLIRLLLFSTLFVTFCYASTALESAQKLADIVVMAGADDDADLYFSVVDPSFSLKGCNETLKVNYSKIHGYRLAPSESKVVNAHFEGDVLKFEIFPETFGALNYTLKYLMEAKKVGEGFKLTSFEPTGMPCSYPGTTTTKSP